MSTSDTEDDDRADSLHQILSKQASGLVSELLDIQRDVEPVEKAHRWAANPLCLLYNNLSPRCFRQIHNRNRSQSFVAISWTWKASFHEKPVSGKYSLFSPTSGKETKIRIRNSVFDRIVKYLEFAKINVFWIDQICIDQNDEVRKAKAMNSMDLIYRDATKTLGLLTTPIRTKRGLRLIELLLGGQMCWKRQDSCYVFQHDAQYGDIVTLLQILYDLTTDIWWTRAWVFQEEYISGLRMDLLIPLAEGMDNFPSTRSIPGELCVSASDFRKHATIFLLAYKNTRWKRYQVSCDRILGIVGKYNILFPRPEDSHVCMSARILADVGKRDVTKPWDVLAITANACGYDRRLNQDSLMQGKKSLSLCLLALYLLNGEVMKVVFDPDKAGRDLFDNDIATFVNRASLQKYSPYNAARELSFFKNCRLPSVRFCHRGIQTSGFVWKLQREHRVYTRSLPLSSELHAREGTGSQAWEATILMALAERLRRKHPSLASKLVKYVENRRSGTSSNASGFMDRMATSLVRAIEQGYVLRIGYLDGGGAGAVFIPHRDDIVEPMHAFTAWQLGSSEITNLHNFVSVKVDINNDEALDVVGWMDGLAFFHGAEAEPVMLSWPRLWKEQL